MKASELKQHAQGHTTGHGPQTVPVPSIAARRIEGFLVHEGLYAQESQTATHFSFTDGEAVLEASIIHPQFLQDYPGAKDIRRQSQD